jgi:hypothetical protein
MARIVDLPAFPRMGPPPSTAAAGMLSRREHEARGPDAREPVTP